MIAGLTLVPDWIDAELESAIVSGLGLGGKRSATTQRNRIERFGPGVPRSGYTEANRYAADVPRELADLGLRLVADGHLAQPPDAVTVGWYLAGQGIRPHVDSPKAGDVICVLGFLGEAQMRFSLDEIDEHGRAQHGMTIRIEPRALVVLAGAARWQWKHEILPVPRPRIAVVFRRATAW